MSESLNERSAGIWIALVIYVTSGVYMLSFWAVLSQSVLPTATRHHLIADSRCLVQDFTLGVVVGLVLISNLLR